MATRKKGDRNVTKKNEESVRDDYQKMRDEMLIEQVKKVFRTQPKNYIAVLEELGFVYHEDDDEQEMEEKKARPENENQRSLVAYFEGRRNLSETILTIFLAERDADEPNYPLIRKYFKSANQNLKALLLYGLDWFPGRLDLLDDLAFFHEFENILSTLITYYSRACVNQENLQTFGKLAQDFYYAAIRDGYDALHALRELFDPGSDKRKVIDFLISEEKEPEKEAEPIKI